MDRRSFNSLLIISRSLQPPKPHSLKSRSGNLEHQYQHSLFRSFTIPPTSSSQRPLARGPTFFAGSNTVLRNLQTHVHRPELRTRSPDKSAFPHWPCHRNPIFRTWFKRSGQTSVTAVENAAKARDTEK